MRESRTAGRQPQAYVAAHYSPSGLGSGYTIVVAGCETMARELVFQYLTGKGTRPQVMGRNYLDICTLEDSTILSETVIPEGAYGVLFEYSLEPADGDEVRPLELVYDHRQAA